MPEFTEEQTRLCHEAKEFDHECIVCRTAGEDDGPGEAVPGVDF
jgi:hypothetical protein